MNDMIRDNEKLFCDEYGEKVVTKSEPNFESLDMKKSVTSNFPSWMESYPYPRPVSQCTSQDNELDRLEDDWDSDSQPRGERWPPLGAPNDDEEVDDYKNYR